MPNKEHPHGQNQAEIDLGDFLFGADTTGEETHACETPGCVGECTDAFLFCETCTKSDKE